MHRRAKAAINACHLLNDRIPYKLIQRPPHKGGRSHYPRLLTKKENLEFFRETRTDAEGSYRISNAGEGTYRFGVAASGLEYEEYNLSIGPSDEIRDVSLQPERHPGRWVLVGDTLPDFLDATDIALLTPGSGRY